MNKKTKDKSSITPAQCLIYYFFWGSMLSTIYKNLIFITISGFTTKQSTIVFLMCIVCSCIIGGKIRWRKCMTMLGVAEDVLIGLGVYTVVSYIRYYTQIILIVGFICIALILSVAYLCLSHKYKGSSIFRIKHRNKRNRIIKNRLLHIFAISCFILSLGALAIDYPITYNRLANNGIISSAEAEASKDNDQEISSLENTQKNKAKEERMKQIAKIENDDTFEIPVKEKLDVVQAIINDSGEKLGTPFPVTAVIDDLDENTLASYCRDTRTIRFDKDFIEEGSSEDILNTTLHESYHAYQVALTDFYNKLSEEDKGLQIFDDCPIYIYEMENYESGEDHDKYYNQWLEVRARDYADYACERYHAEIEEYLNSNQ